jgi:hypothetical protein
MEQILNLEQISNLEQKLNLEQISSLEQISNLEIKFEFGTNLNLNRFQKLNGFKTYLKFKKLFRFHIKNKRKQKWRKQKKNRKHLTWAGPAGGATLAGRISLPLRASVRISPGIRVQIFFYKYLPSEMDLCISHQGGLDIVHQGGGLFSLRSPSSLPQAHRCLSSLQSPWGSKSP